MATIVRAGEGSVREVSLERIFSRGFGTMRANPLATLGIAFLCNALPSILVNWALAGMRADFVFRIGMWGVIAAAIVSLVIGIVLNAITQGAVVRATVAHSDGREASFGESLLAGLVVIVPLVVVSILSAVAISVGLLLLIVPGAILYCMWAVVAPVVAAERTGPITAFGRSAYLTAGARWKVFGLGILLLVGSWIAQAIMGVILVATGGLRNMASAMDGGFPLTFVIVSVLVTTVVSCIWSVLVSALYVELRDWKDGPRSEALADVFR